MGSTLQHVYASNLRQNLGYPLRNPSPTDKFGQPLSPPYCKEGFQIGDVGYVDDYEKSIRFAEPVTKQAFNSKTVLMTGVKRNLMDPRAEYAFTTASRAGAILILPDGALLSEVQDKQQFERFQELAMKYALQWCRFAKQDSLYLVTAVYKSKSWTLGAFYDGSPGEEILIQRRSGDSTETSSGYDWQYQSNVDNQQGPGKNNYLNQTVLIKGFKMTVRWDRLPVVERAERGEWWLSRLLVTLWLTMNSWWWLSRIRIKYIPALNFSQPHHPLDIINGVLLEKNPGARVAVSHDNDWIEMLERGLLLTDLMREDRLRAFVVNKHTWDIKRGIVYLRTNNLEGAKSERKPTHNRGDLAPTSPSNNPRLVITNMRLECTKVDPIYAGICILIGFGYTTRRTTNKPHANVIEWEDEVVLPFDLPVSVRVCGAFQLGSSLGTRDICAKQTIDTKDLSGGVHMIRLSMGTVDACSSLLITLERHFSNFFDTPSIPKEKLDIVGDTSFGFKAFYAYHDDHKEEDLERAIVYFQSALEQCEFNTARHATALFNLATSKLIMCQARGGYSELDIPITLFEEALKLRKCGHVDRPATLLLLAQALLSRHGQEYDDEIVARIHSLLVEIPPDDSRDRQTADAIIRTCRFHRAANSRNRAEVDELCKDWDRCAYVPPYGYFDRPHMLHKLGVALWVRFQRSANLADLDKSIASNEEVLHLIPYGHDERPNVIACLHIAHLVRRIKESGDFVDLDMNVPLAAFTKLKLQKFDVYRTICDALDEQDHVTMAIACYQQIEDELPEDTSSDGERARWVFDFKRRCREKLDKLSDDAMETNDYDKAIRHFSTILLLKPADHVDILIKRNRARSLMKLWDEALSDADEVIRLEPSSHRGYGIKHDTLHSAERHAEAVDPFTMLAKLKGSGEMDNYTFQCRCRESIEKLGDIAMDSGDYDVAAQHFSMLLSLNLVDCVDILIKRCTVWVLLEFWDKALSDADEVINLDSLTHRGYEMKHVALHGARRHAEATDAFNTVFSKLKKLPDVATYNVQCHCRESPKTPFEELHRRYVDARHTMRRVVKDTLRPICGY